MNRITLIVVCIAFAGFTSCGIETEETRPIYKNIVETVFAPGQLEAEQTYDLTARTEGYIEYSVLEEGLEVKPGQLLVSISNRERQIELEQTRQLFEISNRDAMPTAPEMQKLQNNVMTAEAKYRLDSIQWSRYDRLYGNGSISKSEWETAEYEFRNSRAAWINAKESYAQAVTSAGERLVTVRANKAMSNEMADYRQIRGLVSGKVLVRFKQVGDFVKKGDVLARIGDVKRIYVKVYVDEESIARVRVGQKVFVRLNAEKFTLYHGEVDEVFPEYDQQQQAFACKIRLVDTPRIRILGTQVEANIIIGEERNTLVIPRRYLDEGGRVQIKGDRKKSVVKTGFIGDEWVEILSGIDSSKTLITEQLDRKK